MGGCYFVFRKRFIAKYFVVVDQQQLSNMVHDRQKKRGKGYCCVLNGCLEQGVVAVCTVRVSIDGTKACWVRCNKPVCSLEGVVVVLVACHASNVGALEGVRCTCDLATQRNWNTRRVMTIVFDNKGKVSINDRSPLSMYIIPASDIVPWETELPSVAKGIHAILAVGKSKGQMGVFLVMSIRSLRDGNLYDGRNRSNLSV